MKRILSILLAALCLTTQAREIYTLNEGWRFFFADENSSDNARIVSLPHTWNLDAAGAAGSYLRTSARYTNTLVIPDGWRGKRLFVKFYGVQNTADLFVNGQLAGEHRGGTTAFTFEITDKVRFGAENILSVAVSNYAQNDILPVSTDQNVYGGIYRDIELIVTGQTCISPLYLGSDGVLIRPKTVTAERLEAEAEVHLLTRQGETALPLTLEVTAPDGSKVYGRTQKVKLDGKPVKIAFAFDRPERWSPASPALYRVTAIAGEGAAADTVNVRTGFRQIEVTSDRGFLLNGEPMQLHGVTLYYDRPGVGNALLPVHCEEDFALLREMGANALRSPSGPHAPSLYDLCDETGVLVWIDLPFTRAPFLGDIAYFATERFRENGRQQLREIIAQHLNRPSVAMWGIFASLRQNGDDVKSYLEELNGIARELDASRPTVACSNQDGAINFITDLICWRQNVGWERGSTDDLLVWSEQLHTKWRKLRSAVIYGGEGFTEHQGDMQVRDARQNWMPEGRQTRFHEEYARHLGDDSLFWGIWIDALTDYGAARRPAGIDGKGLVTFDRRKRKDAFYLYKALWNKQEPTLYIADRRNRMTDDTLQLFKIYSSAGVPLLRINEDTVTVYEYAPCQYLSDTVTIKGRGTIEASAGGLSDRMEIRTGIALKPRQQHSPRRRASLSPTN